MPTILRAARTTVNSNRTAKRRWALFLPLLVALSLLGSAAQAQVSVTASAGNPGPINYATLQLAFAAVNDGTHQGAVSMAVTADTTETVTAVLNASGAGAAVYTAVSVSPSGGAARTISGAIAAGSSLIDLNGADNVTIDGLNSGGNSLTIANTTNSATSGTSTIRYIGGATNNVITNSNIQGSSSMSVATNGGTIFFSTDAATANGNDNNTISNNNIGPAGANLPSKAILSNGSTTTQAIGNSGNIINNNNIFDFFGAAVTSAGVATNAGSNTWTITNNRFYQTATRTWTTGALHTPINIANATATSGAQGFTITGNIVGFASNTQTGTYTLTGAGAGAKFQGIVFSGITGGALSNINSNTVAAVSLTGVTSSGTTTSSPFSGIIVANGSASTNSNVIGSQAATGSLTYSTTTTTATDVHGIFNFSFDNWTANSNNVGGISVTNLGASGTFVVVGMRANTGTANAFNATTNNVGGSIANSIQLTAPGSASQVIGMHTANAIATWTSNTVRNLTNNTGTGTTTTASLIGMSLTSTTPNQNVAQNTIFGLSNTNTTAATVVTGIQFTGGTANVVQRNLIHSLVTASNSTGAEINGIRVAGGTTVYRNNMIAVGAGIANAIGTGSTTGGVNGINEPLGTDTFFHNSVYVGGAPSAGVGPSYAFNSSQTVNTRSFRDNIFFNARSNAGATGKNYAVRVGGTTPNPAGLTINNNVYFANGAGAVFGFFNSLDVANLAAWKVAVGQDAASIDGNPAYNDPTNAVPDLHIHPSNATVAEANGLDVGVVDDFDGQTRSGFTPVDIGADAGNFNGVDLAAPVITYTALGNTSLFTNRTLTVTITDVTGVAIGGLAPRIYYNKNAGAYFSQACTLASGTVNNGTWNCVINNADLGGVVVTDTIRYFVIAQDAVGNIASNPSGATASDVNTVTVPPAAPNSYLIATPISGVRTVCAAGCDFPTLTGAAGIFNAINTNVLTGNTEIQIAGDLIVGEDGTRALNVVAEEPTGSNFTIRIYPTGAPRAITGSFNGALVRMNGASRVTIDGSLGGVGTDRSLTISNTSVTTPSVVLFGSVGAATVTNDTLKNCVIVNGVNTSSAVVISDATVLGNAGLFSNITIQNNDIQRAFVGAFATGGTTPQGGSNLIYTQNTVNTSGANAVRAVGLYMQGVNGATVTQNTVGNLSGANDENDAGIWLATGTINTTVSGNTVTALSYPGAAGFGPIGINVTSAVPSTNNVVSGNTISNLSSNGNATGSLARGIAVSGATSDLTIEGNNVQNIVNTSTGTFPAYGLDVSGGNNVTVKNNFVSNVSFNMTGGAAFSTQFGVFGIRVGAGTGHKIYNNSVNLFGALPGTANTSLLTAAFGLVSTTSTGVDVRDNIFANNITGGTTSIAHVSAYLPAGGTSAMNLTWNNNAYYFGTDAARHGIGQAGTTAGVTFFTTLPALTAYTSTLSVAGTNDNASLASTGAVPFTTSTDLHLLAGTAPISAGVPIAGVTTDIDNDPRPLTSPDIGADEIVAGILAFSSSTYADSESAGTTTITVTRTGGSAGIVSIDYATVAGGSATAGGACGGTVDFVSTSGTLIFPDTNVSQTFTVTLCPDALDEANETVNLALSNPLGGSIMGTPNTAVLTINDDDAAPTISITDVTQAELNAGTSLFGFVVSLSAPSGQTVTVHYETNDGSATVANSDYADIPDTILTFNPGVTIGNVDVTVNGDTAPELTENFFVDLSTATNASILDNQGIGTITNDDASSGPVTITATAGTTGPTDYATLKLAFDAINAGTHQGDVTASIVVSTTETAPAVLNSSGAGPALYTSVVVRPSNDGVAISSPTASGRGVIELNGADNVTIDGDNPGTAGINRNLTLTNTATSTTTFTSLVRVALNVTDTTTASNNTIRNLILSGSATGRNIATATSTSGSENNTYGIVATANASGATTAPTALTSIATTIGAPATATNLIVSNNSITNASRGVAIQGAATTVFPGLSITGNVIGNPTTGGVDGIYAIGIAANGSATATIADNTIYVEGFVGSSASNSAIQIGTIGGGISGATIERNKVNRVRDNNITGFNAYGINLATGNNHVVRNNFVSGVTNVSNANFSTTFGAFGIRILAGTGHTVYHNSVNMNGPLVSGASTTLGAALGVVSTTSTGMNIRNNIFANTMTGGGASTALVSVYLPVSGTSAMNLTWNNNAYFTGSTAGVSGVAHVGATYTAVPAGSPTFAGLYTAANFDRNVTTPNSNLRAYTSTLSAAGTNDNASFADTAPAPFVSSSDLHIPPATQTLLESGGASGTGVTNDIDLDVRNVTPDIGADEFAGTPVAANDIAAFAVVTPANASVLLNGSVISPQASFKNVGTAVQTNVNVQFTITGAGGYNYLNAQIIASINPGSTALVTFAAAPAFTTPGAYVSGAAVTTPDAVAGNDTVAGAFSVSNSLGGTFTVGSGGNFPSLTNTGGIFQTLNSVGATSNVTINIVSDLTGETGTFALNEVAGGFTVTIKPTGVARSIAGSNGTGLIKLSGADGVTIDGSLAAGTDRSLTITNTGAGAVIWIATNATSGANSDTIKNCNLVGPGSFAGQGIIASSGTAFGGAAEFPNSNNTIQNNSFKSVQNAAFISGNVALDQNWLITGNDVGSTVVAEKVSFRGFLIQNASNFTISRNVIAGINSSTGTGSAMSGIQVAGAINGGSIVANRISDIRQNNPGGFGSNGILLGAGAASNITVANNFISDVAAQGFNGVTVDDNGYGIMITTGGGYGIYHNSVLLNSNQGVNAATGITAGINIAAAVTAVGAIDLRDNIFASTQTLGTRYGVIDSSPGGAAIFSTINYNDYFAQNVGLLGTPRANLAAWQTATGQDANSLAVDPLFVTSPVPADLHLQTSSTLLNSGVAVGAVTVDVDNEPRPAATPDIGADEVVQADLSITKTDGVGSVAPGGNTTYTVTATNAGAHAVTGATAADTIPAFLTCNWTCSGTLGGTCAAAGSGNINDNTVNLPAGGSVTYLLSCTVSLSATGSIVNTATVSSATSDPNAGNNSATDTDTVLNASADVGITKTDGSATEIPGTPVVYTIVATNAGPNAAPTVTIVDNFPGSLSGCLTTCLASAGSGCAAGPVAGNINDVASLLVGGTATYTATCNISATATGALSNTATATVGGGVNDPATGNNTATDTDTLVPTADVSITKTDGSTTATPGASITYTIVVSNTAGPSAAPTVGVSDIFPATLTGCVTTCVGSGGGTCFPGPVVGNVNETANLPVGGSVTYTSTCNVSLNAVGTLVNTATATVNGGGTDPNTANNSATDTDELPGIFHDGFESGDTLQWSDTVPFGFEAYGGVGTTGSEANFGYDFAAVKSGDELAATAIAVVSDAAGKPLFLIGARRTEGSGELELSLGILGAGRSNWVPVSEVAQQVRIEWSLADESSLGRIAVSLDGLVILTVDGYAGTSAPATVTLLRSATPVAP